MIGTSRRSTTRGSAGFTLIELMVVMSIIVVLAGIGLAVHANSQTRAREAVLKEDLFRMRDAKLVSEKYLRAIPVDPFTNSNTTWQTEMSEVDAANPAVTPGVFNVKSGTDRTALDGTLYADW
jgi:general secretion pathway protein G